MVGRATIVEKRKALGRLLYEARIASRREQEDMAAKLRLKSRGSISTWERSTRLPPYSKLRVIAEVYGVSFEDVKIAYLVDSITGALEITQQKLAKI